MSSVTTQALDGSAGPGDQAGQGVAYDEAPTSAFHVAISVAAAGGQFSDGYVLGTIGIALSLARDTLQLGSVWLGLLGGASLAGLFLGSLWLAPLADRVGRRPLFVPTMAFFAVLALLQFMVTAAWQLLLLRLSLGVVLGIDYVVCSIVVAEFAPVRSRGRLLSTLVLMWSAGYTVAFVLGTLLSRSMPEAWRWILASSALPAALIFLVRLRIPESPLWLVQQGRAAAARAIIDRYLGRDVRLPVLAPAAEAAAGGSWQELLRPPFRSRAVVGAVFYTAQVIPYFALSTFIPAVFSALGIQDAYASGVAFNAFMLLGAAAGLLLIDRMPRRVFLVGSFYLAGLLLVALVLGGSARPTLVVLTAGLFAFVIAAASTLEFAYLPELFPTRLRAKGVGFGTAASRIGSALSTFLLPTSVETLGIQPTLGLCAAVLFVGGVVCHVSAPETRCQSMESQ